MENNKNIGENAVKENNKNDGNKHKKLLYIIIPVAVILVVAAVVTAVLVTSKGKPKPVRVTDENGVVRTNGGRVLDVVALGDTVADAKRKAYEAVAKIHWQGSWARTDIADKEIKATSRN